MAIKHQKPDPLRIIGKCIILPQWNKVMGEINHYDLQIESYEIHYPYKSLRHYYPDDIPAPDGTYCTHHYAIIRVSAEFLSDTWGVHIGTRDEMIDIRDGKTND